MVQSTGTPFYSGMVDCLRSIVVDEGYTTLYASRFLLPTLLHHAIPFTVHCVSNWFIRDYLAISPFWEPKAYKCWEMAFGLLETLLKLPVETVRRRLMAQVVIQVEEEEEEEDIDHPFLKNHLSPRQFDDISVRSDAPVSVIMRFRTVSRPKVIRARECTVKTSKTVYTDPMDCLRKVILEGCEARQLEWSKKKSTNPSSSKKKDYATHRRQSHPTTLNRQFAESERVPSLNRSTSQYKDEIMSLRSLPTHLSHHRHARPDLPLPANALDWGSVKPWLGITNLYKGFGTYLAGHLLFVGMKEDDE
jgi:hypothetical protein